MNIYVAAPLFSQAERLYNRRLAEALETALPESATVVLPQDFNKVVAPGEGFARRMFEKCVEGVDQADVVVALLDGADADSGTSMELGYAYAKGKFIIGVRSDFRGLEDQGVNLMLSRACRHMLWDHGKQPEEVARMIAEWLNSAQ
jgi:nucleoside 2-deoxyribosyltransferase